MHWVFESPEQLAHLKQTLTPLALPIIIYRLWCDPDMIAARIRKRDPSDLAFELRRSRELVALLNRAAEMGDMDIIIDTTAVPAEQTAAIIWTDLQQ